MTLRLLLFCLFVLFVAGRAGAQCNVKSSITPSNDTIVPVNSYVHFTSTSTGATSFEWTYQNGIALSTDSVYNMFCSVGINNIMLIAKNGICADTSYARAIVQGNQPPGINFRALYGQEKFTHYPQCISATRDSGYLISGESQSDFLDSSFAKDLYFVKFNQHGCVSWSAKYRLNTNNPNCVITKTIPLSDGGFLVAGYSILWTNSNWFVFKLNGNGSIIWQKFYQNFGAEGIFYSMSEASDGYLLWGKGGDSLAPSNCLLVKLNKGGQLVWSRQFSNLDYQYPTEVQVLGNYAYVTGNVVLTGTSFPSQYAAFLTKVDAGTGAVVWSRDYTVPGVDGTEFFDNSCIFQNHVVLGHEDNTGIGYAIVDTLGNILQNYLITHNVPITLSGFNIIPSNDGNLLAFLIGSEALQLQPYYSMHSATAKFSPGQPAVWVNDYRPLDRSYIVDFAAGVDSSIAEVGQEQGQGADNTDYETFYGVLKMGKGGDVTDCGMVDNAYALSSGTQPFTSSDYPWTNADPTLPVQIPFEFNYIKPNSVYTYGCPLYFQGGAQILIKGADSLCNLNETYKYSATKAAGYPGNINFSVDTSAITITATTDTSITVLFKKPGMFLIRASQQSECGLLKDSMYVSAKQPSVQGFSLGGNFGICSGGTAQLSAGPNFVTYLWQNGSTDSVYTVTDSGYYSVTVTDKCDIAYSDTAHVYLLGNLKVSLGPDVKKCNADTVVITATGGFEQYTWSPNYNLVQIDSNQVEVFPAVDTSYNVAVKNDSGCVGFDTVKVAVFYSRTLSLPQDTSFCQGESVVLRPPAGFTAYKWSNSPSAYSDTITVGGTYTLNATDANGCKSTTSINVTGYPKPVVALPDSLYICSGTSYTINPGNTFATYLWQDGSTNPVYTTSVLGTYWVTVGNSNGCTNTDTIRITGYFAKPEGFLPATDSVCAFKPENIAAIGNWQSYLWSTGSQLPQISVTTPGAYWLQVSDANNCYATDTINVFSKQCVFGIFFPSAFTPNGDGKNDMFKPLVYATMQQYYFAIFNRFGQKVFETSDDTKGWDGTLNGQPQPPGTFVWFCSYTIAGDTGKTAKGTIVLLR